MAKTQSFSTTDLQIRKARRAKGRPFMGVDGEGCGVDRHGRQRYMLLRAGPFEKYTGKELTTYDCLDFLLSLPSDVILVGFAFGYDTTQILRDLPAERLQRLFADKPNGPGKSRYTYWNDYAIEYLPRNYLRVCRLNRVTVHDPETGLPREIRVRDEISVRTVWEVFGFFQSSFLAAIKAYGIGERFWPDIDRNKRRRAKFVRITKDIRRYCELECALLAALMEKFRKTCHDADLRPNQWAGSGKIAAYLHRFHKTITRAALLDKLPVGLLNVANDAYYGGRFEITRIGDIPACTEADINSAYPDAMRWLPCLEHGTWQRVTPLWLANAPTGALFVAEASFTHPADTPLCGLPIRSKQGFLYWPRQGRGTYWSCEIQSAEKLGATLAYHHGWRYVSHCTCRPFDWIDPLYKERKRLESVRAGSGQPIKLGINSLYGKLAQRIGSPTYGNFIWAGLITAATRAKLNDAIALDPGNVVMIATDAIVSLKPLPFHHVAGSTNEPAWATQTYGSDLGQWERKDHERLHIVQPGLYWSGRRRGDKRKTRGVSTSIFARHMHRFEKAWAKWCEAGGKHERYLTGEGQRWRTTAPEVAINMTLFIGLRLANARAALVTAGQWARVRREYSYEWSRKRSATSTVWEGATTVRTVPLAGGPDHVSVSHKSNLARLAEIDRQRMEYEDQPEVLDRSMPGSLRIGTREPIEE